MSEIILTFNNLRLRYGVYMLLFLSAFTTFAQSENVGIGTLKPDNSALLDLTSTSKGLLIPRMTLAQRSGINAPATGLIVYQIDFFSGFYFYDGEAWKGIYARNIDAASVNSDPFSLAPTAESAGWSIRGNSGLNAEQNFLGTKDTTALVFKVNNYRSGLIDFRSGNTYFGYGAGYSSRGSNSIAIGAFALHDANVGQNNIAIGFQSLLRNQTGNENVAVGGNSLNSNISGSENVSIGSQAGLRSQGNGNVFIGYKAGMDEVGNNKLYINNNFQNLSLIYGDFEKARVGINTQSPESALSIDSKTVNLSGLEFKQLNSDSPAEKPGLKVLSVDKQGRVILVRDSVGTSSSTSVSVPSFWTLKGSSIENSNAGDVILSNIRFKNLLPSSPTIKSNGKILTVDDNGLIVLARDSISNSAPSYWGLNGSTLSNTNEGKVTFNGPIQFGNIKASNTAIRANGKVLSVDNNGNLILVRDSVSTVSIGSSLPMSASPWIINGENIVNSNVGSVSINTNLILSKLNSDFKVTKSAQKFLTVDSTGNVFLANVPPITPTIPASDWTLDGTNITNKNTGGVYINNGLWVKNGFRLQSGTLELNSDVENKSGLQFTQLKASNTASKGFGKVLSVDDNGNVILVKDSVGVVTNAAPVVPSVWATLGTSIVNSNTGRVIINNGITLPFTSKSTTAISTQKFLTVDSTGNVILANVPPSTPTTTTSDWTLDGANISNKNTGGVYINNGLWAKNGFRLQSGTLELNSDVENKSGLQFTQLKASNTASKGFGKVLSVDDNGNVILVKDSVGVATSPAPVVPSVWSTLGTSIVNSNTGRVIINNGITLPFTSESTTAISTQKFLTVDNTGNVILANVPPSTPPTPASDWTLDGANISNKNTGGVYINNGLWAKNGFRLQSGTLELNSDVENTSGLQFTQLKASNIASKGYGKVLSVDDNGNVILVKDSVGVATSPAPVVQSLWATSGTSIVNSNTGRVIVNNGLTLPFTSESITPISTQKFLTVDNAGNVILGNAPNSTPSPWTIIGNDIVNSNSGKANISNGLSVKSGINIESGNLVTNGSLTNRSGLVLNQLKLSFPASRPSGKVLSVDDNGNVILVRDSVGVTGTVLNTPASWTVSDNNIINSNTGTVSINSLTLPKLSSNNNPTVTSQKVLSVDTDGNVILVNTPTTNAVAAPTVELWKADTGGAILNNNTQGVVITTNTDGKSGLKFSKLSASSAAGDRYGKVLSVDDNGNVILVNDGISTNGSNTGAGWAITDGRLQNSNNGKVVIGTGINSFPGDFQLYVKGGILTERVRVAVANSDRWADYVFENGYKLMPLKDVEKHIDYYHHLPNVPSAEQMVKSGMDITETSAKLLEKIEELTLYLIKANKQIEVLESKVNNLEKTQK